MKLRGAVVLVTGGAKRVGRAIALRLARSGANVAITYNSSSKDAQQTVRDLRGLGVRAEAFKADNTNESQVKAAVKKTVKRLGRLDVLVASAAVFERTPFETVTVKDWDFHMDTNLKGTFFFTKAAGDVMLKQGSGKIITIGDWAGLRPYKHYLPYCVSKAGVIALTKGLAKTLAPKIQVNCVCPGPVLLPPDMDAAEKKAVIAGTPLARIGSPEDIAAAVRFLVEDSDFITGAILPVDGGRLIA